MYHESADEALMGCILCSKRPPRPGCRIEEVTCYSNYLDCLEDEETCFLLTVDPYPEGSHIAWKRNLPAKAAELYALRADAQRKAIVSHLPIGGRRVAAYALNSKHSMIFKRVLLKMEQRHARKMFFRLYNEFGATIGIRITY